jgi:hypothetical protein
MKRLIAVLAVAALVGAVSSQALAAPFVTVEMQDNHFVPAIQVSPLSGYVQWHNGGSVTHQVQTASSLPISFSTSVGPGALSTSTNTFGYFVGTYPYRDPQFPRMRGSIGTPLRADADSKPLGSSFSLTWSSSAPTDISIDVQARYPGTRSFVTIVRDTTSSSGAFHPPRRGTYKLRGRGQNDTGASTGWSPTISIVVT